MKFSVFASAILSLTVTAAAYGQGTFFYDQQSSVDETPRPGQGVLFQQGAPYGESFTPTLGAVGFIKLMFNDPNPGNGLGGTLYVNVRSASITGPILGTTSPVNLPDSFGGVVSFFFPTPVAVVPNSTYFIEPLVQSGDTWGIVVDNAGWNGGSIFFDGGIAQTGTYAWFREGILVPEPSSAALLVFGTGLLLALRRRSIISGHK